MPVDRAFLGHLDWDERNLLVATAKTSFHPNPHPFDPVEQSVMKIFALASILAFAALPAFAGEGQISTHSLNNMGLSGLHLMTDAQGMHVRGLSIATVSGGTGAHVIGAGGGSSFYASGSGSGTHSASGDSASSASDSLNFTTITSGKGGPSYSSTTITFTASAATTASAKAH
jgi:hypothetical protein